MMAVVLALALAGQDLPDEAALPLKPVDSDWLFRANLSVGPIAPPCPADSPARGKAMRDVLVMQFHSNSAGTVTETQCGKELHRVDLTPREAALLLPLFQPTNYVPQAGDQACTDDGANVFEMTAQQDARVNFKCAPPGTLARQVADMRKMMVAQYAN
jgi:hypothetical protein